MLADLIVRRGPLAEQADAVWQRVPQRLINVALNDYDDDAARAIFEEIRTSHGVEIDDVRLLIRASGTEPVMRVMIEALDEEFVNDVSQRLQNFFLA
jgi:phosphoglucosamine mutase